MSKNNEESLELAVGERLSQLRATIDEKTDAYRKSVAYRDSLNLDISTALSEIDDLLESSDVRLSASVKVFTAILTDQDYLQPTLVKVSATSRKSAKAKIERIKKYRDAGLFFRALIDGEQRNLLDTEYREFTALMFSKDGKECVTQHALARTPQEAVEFLKMLCGTELDYDIRVLIEGRHQCKIAIAKESEMAMG